ncbi:uncharacterized protein BDW43DRAFT_274459 [Aspergillus alliaceus]|uniref:uncharacterized protein n=1 Tax=Petromyces alliaceus TaxID=209559 RepID=UPI0012A40AD8|nr:uncharacterized protein BDW43DRAFT_274459 [Aspergillus alliaceus]KAB8234154.1 hypothetical protein BDW43DRAFT_274459 [Aspergillus alliaceus]
MTSRYMQHYFGTNISIDMIRPWITRSQHRLLFLASKARVAIWPFDIILIAPIASMKPNGNLPRERPEMIICPS